MPGPPIAFGTSGWRGILSDDFTFTNLRRVTRAVARYLHQAFPDRAPRVFVGYDTRFLSEVLASEVAEVLAGEGVRPRLSPDFIPTPVVSFAIRRWRLDAGINLTASHNPSQYHGFKLSTRDGAPAPPEITRRIEALVTNGISGSPAGPVPRGKIRSLDPVTEYQKTVSRMVDGKAIRRAGLRIVCDPVYGAGRGYLSKLLSGVARVTSIRAHRDVTFGGHGPDCTEKHLDELCQAVRKSRSALGLANDGDADRFGIVDKGGQYVSANLILALLADHLLETRGYRSGIARTVATTHLLDDVAAAHGVEAYETPVGFKHFRDLLLRKKVFLAGEESSGLSIVGHVPEKDGILAGLLVAEMVAMRGKSLQRQIKELFRKVGPRYSLREDHRVTPKRMSLLRRKLDKPPSTLAGKKITAVASLDGTRLSFGDQSWLLLRASGTEPLVRCYAESRDPKDLRKLLAEGKHLVQGRG